MSLVLAEQEDTDRQSFLPTLPFLLTYHHHHHPSPHPPPHHHTYTHQKSLALLLRKVLQGRGVGINNFAAAPAFHRSGQGNAKVRENMQDKHICLSASLLPDKACCCLQGRGGGGGEELTPSEE